MRNDDLAGASHQTETVSHSADCPGWTLPPPTVDV